MSAYKKNLAQIDWSKKSARPRNQRHDQSLRSDLARPQIVRDYESYKCPVTGKIIEGRAAHEENLKRTDCRLLEPGEKEDNIKRHAREVAAEDKRRDAAIDGMVDTVAAEYF